MKGKQRDTRSLTGLPQATSPSKPQQPAPVKHSPEKKQAATQKAISAPAPGPSEREKKVNVEEKKRKGSTSDKRHGAKKESSVVDKATPNEKKQPPSHRKTSVSDKKQAGEVRCPSSDKKPASSAATTASATSSSSPTSSEKKVLSLSAQGGPKGSEKKSEKLTEWEARELRPQLEVLDSISKVLWAVCCHDNRLDLVYCYDLSLECCILCVAMATFWVPVWRVCIFNILGCVFCFGHIFLAI